MNKDAPTYRIETTIRQLEEHFQEVCAAADISATVTTNNNNAAAATAAAATTTATPTTTCWEDDLKALEVTALELVHESKDQLQNPKHLLLIPCLRLHLDIGDQLQIRRVLLNNRNNSSTRQYILLLTRLLTSQMDLLDLQTRLYGKDSFELAKTNLDLAQTIEELLQKDPKRLISMMRLNNNNTGMASFQACSSFEYQCRKEHERIKRLYPHDVEILINNKKKAAAAAGQE